MRIISYLLALFLSTSTQTQLVRRVLFLGNSYTDVNSLPVLIQNAALSAGDSLYFQSELAGGSMLGKGERGVGIREWGIGVSGERGIRGAGS